MPLRYAAPAAPTIRSATVLGVGVAPVHPGPTRPYDRATAPAHDPVSGLCYDPVSGLRYDPVSDLPYDPARPGFGPGITDCRHVP